VSKMEWENIDKISNKEELSKGRVYFVKTEPINDDLTYEEDEGNHRQVEVHFQNPPQVYMDYEGSAFIRNCRTRQEATGLASYLLNKTNFQRLIDRLQSKSDIEFDKGIEINGVVVGHSFYIVGCETKEQALGLIQHKTDIWIYKLRESVQRHKGNIEKEGDEQSKKHGKFVQEKIKEE